MKEELYVRILVSKESLEMDEDGRGARAKYSVYQEDRENVILNVPEGEAEEVATRLGGLVDLSE